MRSVSATLLILVLGGILFWYGTNGFQAFTTEGARRLAIEKQPRAIPAVWLEDAEGKKFRLQDYQGKLVLLTYMYTGCADTCIVVESNFREVFQSIPQKYLGKDVLLVSISFDQEHDTPPVLKRYGYHYGADGSSWRMARVADKESQDQLLHSFEVTVIPDENGGYEHNSAFYLVDQQSRLVKIFDYDSPRSVVDYLMPILARSAS